MWSLSPVSVIRSGRSSQSAASASLLVGDTTDDAGCCGLSAWLSSAPATAGSACRRETGQRRIASSNQHPTKMSAKNSVSRGVPHGVWAAAELINPWKRSISSPSQEYGPAAAPRRQQHNDCGRAVLKPVPAVPVLLVRHVRPRDRNHVPLRAVGFTQHRTRIAWG